MSLSATVTAGGGAAPDGTPVTFSIGNAQETTTTSSGVANATLQLVDLPGDTYQATASFAGGTTLKSSFDTTPFAITQLSTQLALAPSSGTTSLLDGADTGITATLTSALPPPAQLTVEFVLTSTSGGPTVVQTRATDPSGVAKLGVVTVPLSGTYTVAAFFGPGAGRPAAPTLLADPVYLSSQATTGASITAGPVSVTSVTRVPPNPTNAGVVSWTVSFSGPVSPLTGANFAFPGISDAAFKSVTSAGGNSYTVSATTGTADGTLGLSVTGVKDSVAGTVPDVLNQAPFTIDKTAPVATIGFPVASHAYSASGFKAGCSTAAANDLCGTVSDPHGPNSVSLSISNGTSFLTSGGFTAGSETFLPAIVNGSNWTFTLASLPADGTYTVHVKTTDGLGNTQAAGTYAATATFTLDTVAPLATITFPVSGGAYNAAGFKAGCATAATNDLCGTVTDPDGPISASLSISNGSKYLTSGGSFTAGTETFLPATVTGSSWAFTLASLPPDGTYTVHVKTTDGVGNTQAAGVYAATGTFTLDTVAPTISFVGNSGSYGLLDQVKITCTASAGSGTPLTTNPCTAFSINQPAWSFAPGKNTVPSPGLVATDKAGNSTSPAATTSFTVTATTSTLCTLTTQFVQGSAKYAALSAAQKKVVSALASGLCTTLSAVVPKLSPAAKTLLVNAYKSGVQSLVTQGWLTSAQATTLDTFVATI